MSIRKNIVRSALLLGAGAITLGACTGPAPATPVALPPVSTSSTPAPVTKAPATDASGFIPKALGQTAGMTNPDGTDFVTFAIDKITVDPKCSQYGSRTPGMHTLAVSIRIATGHFADTTMDSGVIDGTLNGFGFQTRNAAGLTHQGSAGTCLIAPSQLPNSYSENSKYAGTIEIETPDTSGDLLLSPPATSGGWAWKF
jgi:hypothetical protein